MLTRTHTVMGIEIEKKYRLKRDEGQRLATRLADTGAPSQGIEFEENIIYMGGNLDPATSVLRIRRVGGAAILTYKQRFASDSAIKQLREDETRVEDGAALALILEALGYEPSLVYEKRRRTWRVADALVMIDELPFGLFAEIEGEEDAIHAAEKLLGLEEAEAEMATYPELTRRHGERVGVTIEARFSSAEGDKNSRA